MAFRHRSQSEKNIIQLVRERLNFTRDDLVEEIRRAHKNHPDKVISRRVLVRLELGETPIKPEHAKAFQKVFRRYGHKVDFEAFFED